MDSFAIRTAVCMTAFMTGAMVCASEDLTTPGNHMFKIKAGGLDRDYWVRVPKGYDAKKPAAMLIALPAGRGFANPGDEFLHFADKADKENVVLVYTQASKECGSWAAYINSDPKLEVKGSIAGRVLKWADEPSYFNAVIDEVEKNYAIDKNKVFLTGASGGGLMAYRISTLIADRLTGVAIVAGNLVWRNEYPQEDPVKPSRPVSIIHFHGDQDKNVGYEHGANANITVWSAHESTGFWVKVNGCNPEPERETLTGAKVHECTVKVEHWTGAKNAPSVMLCTKVGGVHETPGYANELMWDFFKKEVERRAEGTADKQAK